MAAWQLSLGTGKLLASVYASQSLQSHQRDWPAFFPGSGWLYLLMTVWLSMCAIHSCVASQLGLDILHAMRSQARDCFRRSRSLHDVLSRRYASISSHSLGVRLRTRYVRLPIPSLRQPLGSAAAVFLHLPSEKNMGLSRLRGNSWRPCDCLGDCQSFSACKSCETEALRHLFLSARLRAAGLPEGSFDAPPCALLLMLLALFVWNLLQALAPAMLQ